MSWWVTDYIAVSEDETQQLCNIQADAVSDLPAQDQTATAGFIFVRGSKAYVLSTSGQYIMNSSGQWILQKSGQEIEISADDIVYNNTDSGITATNVQDAIDELKDTDDTQDNALVELYAENANQQLEINYAINTGSKNVLNLTLTTQTTNGVTFTVNDDQTITINGTPTTSFATTIVTVTGLLGDYTLTGCPSGGSGSTYRLYRAGASASESDVGSGYTYTFEPQNSHAIRIYLYTGNTFNNLTFKPMLRAAEIKSNTFEPYAPTNRELYETKLTAEDVWGYGQLIPDSADLNDYTTGGKYYGGNSAGSTVLNLPVANETFTFTLEVKLATPSMTYQYLRVCRLADDPYIYCRRKYTTWGSWYRFTGEAVVTSVQSVNSLSTLNLDRNDLDESLDTNFDLIDSIPEEEEGEEDV